MFSSDVSMKEFALADLVVLLTLNSLCNLQLTLAEDIKTVVWRGLFMQCMYEL